MTDLPSIQDIVDEELACDHTVTAIRYKLDSLKRRLYVNQCLGCGAQVGDAIKHSEIETHKNIAPFDEVLRDGFWKLRQIKYREIAAQREEMIQRERQEQDEQRRRDWFAEYSQYLKSDEWEWRRLAVLARDGYKCQARYPGCFGRATIAHHLTYDHRGNEPLFDLVAVCSKCHKMLHPEND